jgi:chorismate dehydratase
VGAVSYLNTKPLIYGFERGMMQDAIDLVIDYPSNIARALLTDEIDIGLVPVAVIPEMKEYHIISDYGIGCNGDVASVCLFSEVPLEEIKTILLDYQSRSSIALLKVLLKEYWKINPELKETNTDFRSRIQDNTAAIVIGDRALEQRRKSRYVYDLGGAWKAYTNLPFVFAAWISNKPMSEEFVADFNRTNEYGLSNIDRLIQLSNYPVYDLKKYYTANIKFVLDLSMREAINLFLTKLKSIE